jgi:D-beta-D-heptose 7-phosphate kinase/D-beta-D-heptose 1-phosphate adenosyltransferase
MTDSDILERIPNMSALVAGDLCVNYRCTYDDALGAPQTDGRATRIAVIASDFRPGLGGSVAADLAALGCGRVAVLGVAGSDGHGFELQNALRERGVSIENLIRTPELPTWTSMRFLNTRSGMEDQPRVEFTPGRRLPETLERQIVNRYQSIFDGFNLVYIADYALGEGGVVNEPLRKLIDELAPAYPDKIVIVDSKANLLNYRRVILKPDRREAEAASMELLGRIDYAALREKLRARLLVLTHEGQAVSVYDSRGAVNIPSGPYPTSGQSNSGGAFGAAFGLALAITRDVLRATEFANLVAAITAAKRTEGIARPHEILHNVR